MYTISHMVNCIHCNSCNLFDNTQSYRNTLSCNELQMVIATQNPSCKVSCKSPYFFIVILGLFVIFNFINYFIIMQQKCANKYIFSQKRNYLKCKFPCGLYYMWMHTTIYKLIFFKILWDMIFNFNEYLF